MTEEKQFKIIFDTESGILGSIRVKDEAELAKALVQMLKGDWNRLVAGDTIRIVEE